MVRNELLPAVLIAFLFVPAAHAVQCSNENKTREVYVTFAGCANVPKEFVIRINGLDKTVTRPNPNVARWHVQMDQSFCIPETKLTSVDLPGFRTACQVSAKRAGPTIAPVAIFHVPCAGIWGLVVEKINQKNESKFRYRINRDPAIACNPKPESDLDTQAPDSIGDLALRDDVTVSVIVEKGKPLVVTVNEVVLRAKPAGARFGLLFKSSPARNEQTDLVRDAYADRVDLIFKRETAK